VKRLPYLCAFLLLGSLFSGCETTRRFWTFVSDLAVGVYKATPHQVQLADERASAAFNRFSAQEKKVLKESG
jgi:hypothetical protein